MKIKECKVGMKVKVTETFYGNEDIIGEVGIITKINRSIKCVCVQFIRDVASCWKDKNDKCCWNIHCECIEPVKRIE